MSTSTQAADQTQRDAEKEINNAYPDDASKEAAADTLAGSFAQPDVKRSAEEDVKTLADTIRSIRENFLKVNGDLLKFDNEKFKDTSGKAIALAPEWSTYIKEFDVTMQRSLEEATEAVSTLKTVTAVLGDVEPDLRDDLLDELQNFINAMKGKDATSLEIRNRFVKLADNVKTFATKMDVALEQAGEALANDLKRAQAHLEDLTKQLESVNKQIDSLANALNQLNAGPLQVIAAVVTLNPMAIIKSIISLLEAKGTQKKLDQANDHKNRLEADITKTKREIDELQSRQKLLEKYRKTFADTKVTIESIFAQLLVIANIWSTINSDIHALHTTLSHEIKPGQPITRFFLKKLTVAKELYKHLCLLLEIYIEQVKVAGPGK